MCDLVSRFHLFPLFSLDLTLTLSSRLWKTTLFCKIIKNIKLLADEGREEPPAHFTLGV